MNLAIPPGVFIQALLALFAGLSALTLGVYSMHRAWRYHDHRSERDFLIGFCASTVGAAWVMASLSIGLGEVFTDEAAQVQVQEVVVFTNAAARIIIILISLYLAHEVLSARKER